MAKSNLKTNAGIVTELESSLDDFKKDNTLLKECELRARICNFATKAHMVDYLAKTFEARIKKQIAP